MLDTLVRVLQESSYVSLVRLSLPTHLIFTNFIPLTSILHDTCPVSLPTSNPRVLGRSCDVPE